MDAYRNLLIHVAGAVATVTLNRPDKLNPLDWATVKELNRALAEIDAAPALRLVILTGAGRAFSAGGDLEGYMELYRRPDDFRQFLADFHALNARIEASEKVFIAAVNGVTVAGGLELMLACDIVVAAEAAKIGDGHLNFAQLPGAGGSQRLPRAIGALRAKRLVLTGELIDGVEAEQIGLATFAVPGARLMEEVRALTQTLLSKSPAALAGAKRLVNLAGETDLADGLDREIAFVHSYATEHPDAIEGLRAFNEKRPAKYRA